MNDLDRLLELYYHNVIDDSFIKKGERDEYNSLKSKIEQDIKNLAEIRSDIGFNCVSEKKYKKLEQQNKIQKSDMNDLKGVIITQYKEIKHLKQKLKEIEKAWENETHPMSAYNAVNTILKNE